MTERKGSIIEENHKLRIRLQDGLGHPFVWILERKATRHHRRIWIPITETSDPELMKEWTTKIKQNSN